ncbi:MAG: hypothetical protein O2907_06895 [Proteobacteria bacterium]|nr:hypothetical protein [Pseudomonadota bacterium]MDA1064042.1 hypothetical protein [Pseudomonadota bacterium]
MRKALTLILSFGLAIASTTAFGWDPNEVEEYDAKSQEAIAEFNLMYEASVGGQKFKVVAK